MAEVCAERGYAQASVADVAKRAGVSSLTFYEQFAGKEECLLAAHRQLLGRLLEEVDRAVEGADRPEERARVVVRTALALLSADVPSARLLTVEILSAGPQGAKRHDAMVEALAERLWGDVPAEGESPLSSARWVLVAGMLSLIGRLVTTGGAARLPELESDLAESLLSQS
jgi:AcrR family transcriptional regulator